MLWLDLVGHHQRADPSYRVPGSLLTLLRRELGRAFSSPACRIVVAAVGSELQGFALAEVEAVRSLETPLAESAVERGVGWVHELYVVPEWRRRGVGRALAFEALAFLRGKGHARASVRVEAVNPEAVSFWQAIGFVERARILEGEL